jgi:hypothetical protein
MFLKLFSTTLVAICVISFSVNGQKQEKGNATIELEFSPLGSEPLKINSLRTRYFVNQNLALRLNLYAGGKRTTNHSTTPDSSEQLTNRTGNFDFTLRPGLEYHFDIAPRLSPYLGGEVYFGYGINRSKSESLNSNNSIMKTINSSMSSTFGLNAITGTDFYFSEKIYVGVELGFGFLFEGKGKTKIKYENQEGTSGLQNSITKGNTTTLNWGPNYQGTIRIGYCIR